MLPGKTIPSPKYYDLVSNQKEFNNGLILVKNSVCPLDICRYYFKACILFIVIGIIFAGSIDGAC